MSWNLAVSILDAASCFISGFRGRRIAVVHLQQEPATSHIPVNKSHLSRSSDAQLPAHLALPTDHRCGLQCFEAVGWMAGRASSLQKTEC